MLISLEIFKDVVKNIEIDRVSWKIKPALPYVEKEHYESWIFWRKMNVDFFIEFLEWICQQLF